MMQQPDDSYRQLQEENERLQAALDELRTRLQEPEDLIRAIRFGEVDAFVVTEQAGEKVYALRRADQLYRLMIEDMREGAVALASDGTILYSNWHFAALVGARRDELVGRPFESFLASADRMLLRQLICEAGPDKSRGEIGLLNGNGEPIPVYVAANRIAGLADHADVYCLVVTDLTPYKQQEELLRADRRKNEFLAMLAHELRNPLMPIRNAADLLGMQGLDEQSLRDASLIIRQQVEHLTRLVDDLLDVSRITWGKIDLRMAQVELSGAVAQAVEATRPVINQYRHRLSVSVPDEPICVQGDAVRLAQVLGNLLTNAAKYTRPEGDIRLTVEREAEGVAVRVADNGRGIDADLLPRVFDLFTQADSSFERSEGGLGIGLTLVRTLVELHGGTVTAHSDGRERGSEFVVRLPILPACPGQEQPEVPQASGESFRILVVEDNIAAAKILSILLRKLGPHEVLAVHDGPAAIQAVESFRPDVVLLDIGLPLMNGHEVARRLRLQAGGDRLLLVALTGYGQDEDRRLSQDAGFDEHLIKPPSLEALQELLAHPRLRQR